MENKQKQLSDENKKALADQFREFGQPHTADYVEKFGLNLSPWFHHLTPVDVKEKFYQRCVEEGHPWDWYQDDLPEDAIL